MNFRIAVIVLVAGVLGFVAGTLAAEPHSVIVKAERALHTAKQDLEHAARDFGGHRVAAIRYIDQTLGGLKDARKFD